MRGKQGETEVARVRVKICGITRLEDALRAVDLGADALGFVLAESPRRVTPEEAKAIIDHIPPWVSCVGVFVDESIRTVRDIQEYCSLDYLQFHGHEEPAYCRQFRRRAIKAFRIRRQDDLALLAEYPCSAFLLDTFSEEKMGGTGKTFDWRLARIARQYGKIILSGGLRPDNVSQAIQKVRPYAVDASSGLEMYPGRKDYGKLSSFFESISLACRKGSSPASKG
ncbi:MAG: phosphoribosylanthranilate isomerase [bacterium]